MSIGQHSKLGPIPGPKVDTRFKPGVVSNPLGRPPDIPDKLTLRSLLGKHLDGIVKHAIPDADGNQHVIEISRLELLTRLMVQTVFKPAETDHPSFRAECLKQILARIDPVKKDDGNGTGAQIVIVVHNEPGMAFAGTLQRNGQHLSSINGPQVIDALRATPVDIDFNGVTNGNGDNGDEPPQLPADDPSSD